MPSIPRNPARVEKILAAAARLFARQGYHGTSTREIARLANVAENTIFRYFDHKEDIFWAALRLHMADLNLRRDMLDGIVKCEAPDVVLPRIVELIRDTVEFRPELLRLMGVAFLELQWKSEAFFMEAVSPIFSILRQYFAANVRSGRLRDLDPTMVTAALISTVLMHRGVSRLIVGEQQIYADSREAGKAYTKFWLDVLTSQQNTTAGTAVPVPGAPTS
jgi:AcrR family transcriptional regulator